MFIKFNVTNSCEYEFTIVGNYSVDVKLYDANFNEIIVNKTVMEVNRRITFSNTLTSGEYYVRVYSSYSEPQIVDLDIQTNHTHSYTRYRTYSSTQHKAICSCGASILQYHMVDTSGCCVLCLAIVSSGISPLTLNNVNYITENGSYILPNGVIIIVEADMDSFIKNKTDIYNLL